MIRNKKEGGARGELNDSTLPSHRPLPLSLILSVPLCLCGYSVLINNEYCSRLTVHVEVVALNSHE